MVPAIAAMEEFVMKKFVAILGALALVVAMSTTALAEKEICQERQNNIIDVSPKKNITYTIKSCSPEKKDAEK